MSCYLRLVCVWKQSPVNVLFRDLLVASVESERSLPVFLCKLWSVYQDADVPSVSDTFAWLDLLRRFLTLFWMLFRRLPMFWSHCWVFFETLSFLWPFGDLRLFGTDLLWSQTVTNQTAFTCYFRVTSNLWLIQSLCLTHCSVKVGVSERKLYFPPLVCWDQDSLCRISETRRASGSCSVSEQTALLFFTCY